MVPLFTPQAQHLLLAAGLEIPATAEWTIFAPTNKAWAEKDLFKKTGLTAADLMLPENKNKLAQVCTPRRCFSTD